jgi:hypothetical protein
LRRAASSTARAYVYTATDYGTNGGGFDEGDGLLLDRGGDDLYKAGRCGANGGADISCLRPSLGVDATTHGLLVDGNGTDTYEDALVNCQDCTMVPKSGLGAQVDTQGEDPF